MLLMIDSYDSFTYNLVQYLGELGADVKVYRNDAVTVEQLLKMRPSGIVLSPGPGRPEKAGILLELIERLASDNSSTPLLGVCLGHQAIAQAFGGRIGYAPEILHGKTSQINHDGSTLFRKVPSPFRATRYHSLVIEPNSLPDQFIITARTDDDVIMAIQHKRLPHYGVQFHPESILTDEGKNILANFLETLQ